MNWTEAQLLRRLKNNDRTAFEAVVASNYQLVYRQLWYFCHDAEVAADLTQETFTRAWSSLPTFNGQSSIRTWLYTISVRAWYRWKEANANHRATIPLGEWAEFVPDESSTPAQKLERQALRDDVQTALMHLPSPLRETIVLFYVQNLKYREVAEVLDVSLGTVKWRIHEGLKRLKVALNEAEEVENQILEGDSSCKPNWKSA